MNSWASKKKSKISVNLTQCLQWSRQPVTLFARICLVEPIPISNHKMEITSDVNQIFFENGERYTRVIQGSPFEVSLADLEMPFSSVFMSYKPAN